MKAKIIFLFIILVLNLGSCGKKANPQPPPDYKKPNFDRVFE